MSDQGNLVSEIKSLSESIRQKNRALKLGIDERDRFLERTFKPVIAPLKEISHQLGKSIEDDDNDEITTTSDDGNNVDTIKEVTGDTDDELNIMDTHMQTEDGEEEEEEEEEPPSNTTLLGRDISTKGILSRKYLIKMLHNAQSSRNFHVYGARLEKDGVMIGDSELITDNNDNITINGKVYKGTLGLFELIFKNKPTKYTAKDLATFKRICQATNVHKKNYSTTGPVYRNKSNKYMDVISHIFPPKIASSKIRKKRGSGMNMKRVYDTNIIYYNDINKLVDRMRLLHEAIIAGHSGLDNEMVALTEELRKRRFIK